MFNKNFTLLLSLSLVIFLGVGCQTEEGHIDYEEDVLPIIEETTRHVVQGSCNIIGEKSTCIDYRGSIWGENDMKLNCADVGEWSNKTCPYSEIGGCMSGHATITELVIWHYNRGGNPITPEDAIYAAMACNNIPLTKWVTPEEVDFK